MNWNADQIMFSNLWARGSDWWPILKVKNGWIIQTDGTWKLLGPIPRKFKTKKSAIEFCGKLCMIRFQEWGPMYA